MQYLFLILSVTIVPAYTDPFCSTSTTYDIENIINVVNLQFCTIVEIGQGYCNLFLEFRAHPSCRELTRDGVAELYLGTCSCATLRTWDLCSIPLKKARPYECSFEEGHPAAESTARVHRRLCDPTFMANSANIPCDCSKSFAGRTLYPVEGFQTCYRAPMPKSICSTHSVCGVYRCAAKLVFGLALVQCDPNCIGGNPFCEEKKDISSVPPVVTSMWSNWTAVKRDFDETGFKIDEAICLENGTLSPAFDCLGPGSYCCPKDVEDCSCTVSTTMSEMKVTRLIGKKEQKKNLNKNQLDYVNNLKKEINEDTVNSKNDLTEI